jgi:hypothetical protein
VRNDGDAAGVLQPTACLGEVRIEGAHRV